MEKKRKGGAEKLREKKKKAQDAAKSGNILNMFVARAGVASGSSAAAGGPSHQEEEEGESEAPAAMVLEELSGGDGRFDSSSLGRSSPVEMSLPETPSPPVDYFSRPNTDTLQLFLNHHPQQSTRDPKLQSFPLRGRHL